MVGAFTAGLALATIESLGVLYLRPANSLATEKDEQILHEVMGSSLLLAATTRASLGVTWAGDLMKGQGGIDSALLGGFIGLMGSFLVTQLLRHTEAGLWWLLITKRHAGVLVHLCESAGLHGPAISLGRAAVSSRKPL